MQFKCESNKRERMTEGTQNKKSSAGCFVLFCYCERERETRKWEYEKEESEKIETEFLNAKIQFFNSTPKVALVE